MQIYLMNPKSRKERGKEEQRIDGKALSKMVTDNYIKHKGLRNFNQKVETVRWDENARPSFMLSTGNQL